LSGVTCIAMPSRPRVDLLQHRRIDPPGLAQRGREPAIGNEIEAGDRQALGAPEGAAVEQGVAPVLPCARIQQHRDDRELDARATRSAPASVEGAVEMREASTGGASVRRRRR